MLSAVGVYHKNYDKIGFTLTESFLDPTPAIGDHFGIAVAFSGDKVLIGAWFDDTGAEHSGAAYLFDAATGNLLHTFLNPTPDSGDLFGASVAISGDKVLISAWYSNTGAEDRGAAYLFSLVPTSPN